MHKTNIIIVLIILFLILAYIAYAFFLSKPGLLEIGTIKDINETQPKDQTIDVNLIRSSISGDVDSSEGNALQAESQPDGKMANGSPGLKSEKPNLDNDPVSYEIARATNKPFFCTYSTSGLFGSTDRGEVNVLGYDFTLKDDDGYNTTRQGDWMYRWDYVDGSGVSKKINLTKINEVLSQYSEKGVSTYQGDGLFYNNPAFVDIIDCYEVENVQITIPPINFDDRTDYWSKGLIDTYNLENDTDGDGVSDSDEIVQGFNPLKDEEKEAKEIDLSMCDKEGTAKISIPGKTVGTFSLVDACISEEAEKLDNIYVCDRASSGMRWACYTGFAERRENLNICERIDNSSYHKIICYKSLSLIKNDVNICKRILGVDYTDKRREFDQQLCYLRYAMYTDDPSLCESNPTIDGRRSCYSYFGAKNRDPSMCQKVRDLGEEYTNDSSDCYFNVAVFTNDDKMCEKMLPEKWRSAKYENIPRERCFTLVGEIKNENTVCKEVKYYPVWIPQGLAFYNCEK